MSEEQAPPGISTEDWTATPIPVRKLVTSLQATIALHQKPGTKLENHLPFPVILFFNLIFVGVLGFVFNGQNSSPCVHPLASMPGLGVIILAVFHLVWRTFRLNIVGNTIKVLGFQVSIVALDELHPWKLRDLALWLLAFASITAAWFLGLSSLSPFRPQEPTPTIQSFSVYNISEGTTTRYGLIDVLHIKARQLVRVEAVLNQADAQCTWHTESGILLPGEGCSTLYSLSFGEGNDGLTVLVQSPCKTRTATAGLSIVEQP